jgi:hypothetical protein
MKKIGENCIVNRKNISHVVKRQESEKFANFFLTRFLPHSIVKIHSVDHKNSPNT